MSVAGRLSAEARGEVFSEDGVLVLKRIHVRYALRDFIGDEAVVDRVHRVHARACPIYRSIHRAIDISTDYEMVE